ncbi:MAG TPA: ATP-dependent DNA helicase RecG [Candidatus Caccenecus avistercoris]|nr:ATP-dependent DNA helicase RecG [Candidatus Caccenecus avistercoris]
MELTDIKGVGPKTLDHLHELGIYTLDDLLTNYPYRYDLFEPTNLTEQYDNERIAINVQVETTATTAFIRKNFNKLQFRVNHNGKVMYAVIFNRAFLKPHIVIGKTITLVGKYDLKRNTFICDDIKLNPITKKEIIPIYHVKKGIKSNDILKIIESAIDDSAKIPNYVPDEFIMKYDFISKKQALRMIHMPHKEEEIKKAKVYLKYEELFLFLFKIAYMKDDNENTYKEEKVFEEKKIEDFIASLPFTLTDSQEEALKLILDDIKSNKKMNRLVLGDVGSGKTIISFISMYANFLAGYQSVLMAPTEVLARQHFESAISYFKDYHLTIDILVGSMTKKEKEALKARLASGEIDILIGTHAIIEDAVSFYRLGLVITDEQHRFGVKQREILKSKGEVPDALYMSATPIPRTYALTLYGDLDVSFIRHKPGGRKTIVTKIKKYSELKDVLMHVLEEIKAGHQVYVVASIIDDNEELDLKSVETLKEKFNMAYQGKIPIEILHGKLKQREKDAIMTRFKNNETKILISTTVIEVGVDVKNATVMVIFDADRFGLATIHQLRGRVGRNNIDSYCYLISDKEIDRLKVLEESNDGFYIAEKDLELRGEGDLFGTMQSGVKTFKIANLKTDLKIMMQAKSDSEEYLKSGQYKNNMNYKKIVRDLERLN